MELFFINRQIERALTDEPRLTRTYGARSAEVIKRCLDVMRAAPNLDALGGLPSLRIHELHIGFRDEIVVDAGQGLRLILIPANEPVPRKPDDGLDRVSVTAVRILNMVDYHHWSRIRQPLNGYGRLKPTTMTTYEPRRSPLPDLVGVGQ